MQEKGLDQELQFCSSEEFWFKSFCWWENLFYDEGGKKG
jgi:hypothetical protein